MRICLLTKKNTGATTLSIDPEKNKHQKGVVTINEHPPSNNSSKTNANKQYHSCDCIRSNWLNSGQCQIRLRQKIA